MVLGKSRGWGVGTSGGSWCQAGLHTQGQPANPPLSQAMAADSSVEKWLLLSWPQGHPLKGATTSKAFLETGKWGYGRDSLRSSTCVKLDRGQATLVILKWKDVSDAL